MKLSCVSVLDDDDDDGWDVGAAAAKQDWARGELHWMVVVLSKLAVNKLGLIPAMRMRPEMP